MTDHLADTLARFLQDMAGRPFVFGVCDCSLFLADWVATRTGRDPAGELRGSYSTEAEWRAVVAESGGLEILVGRLARLAGLVPINPARARLGDIAVVEMPLLATAAAPFRAGAVCTGHRRPPAVDAGVPGSDTPGEHGRAKWVAKLRRGLIRAAAVPIAAWSF